MQLLLYIKDLKLHALQLFAEEQYKQGNGYLDRFE